MSELPIGNKKVFRWEKDDDGNILVTEVREYVEITKKGMLRVTPQFSTNKFFLANDSKDFDDKLWDIASMFFEDWETEAFFNGYFLPTEFISLAKISVSR